MSRLLLAPMAGGGHRRARLGIALALLTGLLALPVRAASSTRHKHGKPAVEGVLNVNRASEAELRLLPGIGRGRAEAIVARRQERPFASLEEVARIKGLGKLVQRLRAHLVVTGPSTLRPVATSGNASAPSGPRAASSQPPH